MKRDNLLPEHSRSYWNKTTDIKDYPKLEQTEKVDVGIVGGGLTGLTAAYMLSKNGFSVCLIDASKILSGVTSHTTAKITTQHGLTYHELINQFGIEKARLYYDANKAALDFINKLVTEQNLDCEWDTVNAHLYASNKEDLTKLEQEMKAYETLGIPGSLTYENDLPLNVTGNLTMPGQAVFHPLKYASYLLSECENAGVQVYEHTRAVSIEYNKHPAIITQDGHRIICNQVIQASHYPFYDGDGYFPMKMYASRSYLLAVKTERKITNDIYLDVAEKEKTRSIRPIHIDGEDGMLIGGSSHKTGQKNISMMTHFHQLLSFADDNFGVKEILYRWSAQDYVTLDNVPYIGQTTKDKPGILVATGFRKWGMTNATNAALLLADIIRKKENPYVRLFTPEREKRLSSSAKGLVTNNLDVAKHLIKGKINLQNDRMDQLNKNESCIMNKKGKRIGVYKDNQGKLFAVDTTCTHLGCEVIWNEAEVTWDCPCHGSRYTYEGNVINGPAVKGLNKIDIT